MPLSAKELWKRVLDGTKGVIPEPMVQTWLANNDAIRLDATAYPALTRRGRARIDAEDFSGATQDAEAAIAVDPGRADGYYLRGLVAAYQGRDDAALVDYDRAIAMQPDHLEAVAARARAYLRQGNADGALRDCDQLIAAEPGLGALYAMRGAAKAMGGDTVGASADFDRALALTSDPDLIDEIKAWRRELGLE